MLIKLFNPISLLIKHLLTTLVLYSSLLILKLICYVLFTSKDIFSKTKIWNEKLWRIFLYVSRICRVSVYLLWSFSQEVVSFLIQNHHTYQDNANKSGQISNPDNFRDCVEHSSKIIEICFCQLKLEMCFYTVIYLLQVFSSNLYPIW